MVIVFRSNAIDNNNDDEKMTPNDVNEEAEDSLQERSSKENSCNRNRKKEALKETVRKKEALKKAVHKTIPHLLHLSMLIISSVFLFLKNLVPMLSWQIQEIVVKFKLHKKESKLLPIEQMFPKKELFFREERVLKNERATL